MGLLDVPRGVNAKTGMLQALATVTLDDAEISGQRIRWDLGPGFAVGIHAVHFSFNDQINGTTDEVDFALSLDPELSITTFPSIAERSIIALFNMVETLSTNGVFISVNSGALLNTTFPAPVLTVQDATFVAANNLSGSTSVGFVGRVFYSIYEVSDAEFLRIAGVSLARG